MIKNIVPYRRIFNYKCLGDDYDTIYLDTSSIFSDRFIKTIYKKQFRKGFIKSEYNVLSYLRTTSDFSLAAPNSLRNEWNNTSNGLIRWVGRNGGSFINKELKLSDKLFFCASTPRFLRSKVVPSSNYHNSKLYSELSDLVRFMGHLSARVKSKDLESPSYTDEDVFTDAIWRYIHTNENIGIISLDGDFVSLYRNLVRTMGFRDFMPKNTDFKSRLRNQRLDLFYGSFSDFELRYTSDQFSQIYKFTPFVKNLNPGDVAEHKVELFTRIKDFWTHYYDSKIIDI